MKNGWLLWFFIIGVVVTVFISFNYEGSKNVIPLSEIFPEDKEEVSEVEYEFVDAAVKSAKSLPAKVKNIIQPKAEKRVEEVQTSVKPTETNPSQAVEEAKKTNTKLTFNNASTTSSPLKNLKKAIVEAPSAILDKNQEPVVKQPAAASSKEGNYTIQVASFKKQDSANQELEKLLKSQLPAFVKSRDLKEKGVWYRVYVGRFNTKKDADDYLKDFKVSYKDGFVIKLKK